MSSGEIRGGVHRWLTRVYYEDTDAAGVVYHANYLKFAERARTEFLRLLGIDQRRWRAEAGLGFAVRRCVVEYRAPAHLDDEITVESRLTGLGRASLAVDQCLMRSGRELARLAVSIACIGIAGRPARLPATLHGKLSNVLVTSGKP